MCQLVHEQLLGLKATLMNGWNGEYRFEIVVLKVFLANRANMRLSGYGEDGFFRTKQPKFIRPPLSATSTRDGNKKARLTVGARACWID